MQIHTDFAIFAFRNLARTITNKNKHKNTPNTMRQSSQISHKSMAKTSKI